MHNVSIRMCTCCYGTEIGGLVSNANTFPSVGSGDIQRFCQLGPLSRHSEDLWPLLVAMKTKLSSPDPAATVAGGSTNTTSTTTTTMEGCVSDDEEDEEDEGGFGEGGAAVTRSVPGIERASVDMEAEQHLSEQGARRHSHSLDECSDCSTCSEGGGGEVLFAEGQLLKESSDELLNVSEVR